MLVYIMGFNFKCLLTANETAIMLEGYSYNR